MSARARSGARLSIARDRLPAGARTLVSNAVSLVGTTVFTSVLGVVYWWVAARAFAVDAVGLASAAVSTMTLVGSMAVLGFGTLLTGELPRRTANPRSLVVGALIFTGVVGLALGLGYGLTMSAFSPSRGPLGGGLGTAILFAVGASLTTMTLVLDQAFVGLLRADLQFFRNAVFAVAKLVLLVLAATYLDDTQAWAIFASWVLGTVVSVFVVGRRRAVRRGNTVVRPEWRALVRLGPAAVSHHGLNMTMRIPLLAVPVVVAAMLTPATNAAFYMAWMMANLITSVPVALTTVLYAVGASDSVVFAGKLRLSLQLSFVTFFVANVVLSLGGTRVLALFGNSYYEDASTALHILGVAILPLIVKSHYVAIIRIRGRLARSIPFFVGGAALEIGAAIAGAFAGGLEGLCLAWTCALGVEALYMGREVIRAASFGPSSSVA